MQELELEPTADYVHRDHHMYYCNSCNECGIEQGGSEIHRGTVTGAYLFEITILLPASQLVL